MRKILFLSILFTMVATLQLAAQDTLPNIAVKNISGQIIISWKNNYKKQLASISIQRSFDSLKNYTTIGSVLSPQNAENGYADVKPPYNKMYYRVFISFEGGNYFFSPIRRPVKDTARSIIAAEKSDSLAEQKIIVPLQTGWVASRKIYSGKDNHIIISLPDAATKKYAVRFFDELHQPVFELNKITETYLIIERVNFVHAGWFHFELYENGHLVESNKFYVFKDGKNQQIPVDEMDGKNK